MGVGVKWKEQRDRVKGGKNDVARERKVRGWGLFIAGQKEGE